MSAARISIPTFVEAGNAFSTRLQRFLRLIWIELRFSYAWLFMPLAVIGAVWFFNAWLWEPGRRWDVVSSNAGQSFLLIGPAGAMWSAFVAAREGRSRLGDLTASMPVGSLPRHLVVIGTPVVGSVMAYGIGALAMMGWYGRSITWGRPDWGIVGYGAVVVLACAMVGAAFGRVLHGRFAPVIISGTIFLYFVMSWSISNPGDSLRGWALLSYPRDGIEFSWPLTTYPAEISADEPSLAAGFVICGAIIAFSLAVLVVSHGRWKTAVPFAVLAIVAVAVAMPMTTITDGDRAIAMAAFESGPIPVENPPLVCAGEVVTTCLHKIDQRDLEQVSEAVDILLGPVEGLAGVPHTIEMRMDLKSEPGIMRFAMARYEIDAYELSHTLVPFIFDEDGGFLNEAEQVIAAWLVLPVHQLEDVWFFTPPDSPYADEDSEEVRAWQAEIVAGAERFAALSPEEQRAWLEANWDALRADELSLEDLP